MQALGKLFTLITIIATLTSGLGNSTHAQTLTSPVAVGKLLGTKLLLPGVDYSKDSLFTGELVSVDTANYIKEVFRQVMEDLQAGKDCDTVRTQQAAYIKSLEQENAAKDSVIQNRDSTVYEFRGQVLALRREEKYKDSLNATLSKEVKYTRKCLAVVVVLWIVVTVGNAVN